MGFFISDHPLNQYKDYFSQYNVINFNDFNLGEKLIDGIVAATILSFKKKNQKGSSYAIIKFTDLWSI